MKILLEYILIIVSKVEEKNMKKLSLVYKTVVTFLTTTNTTYFNKLLKVLNSF